MRLQVSVQGKLIDGAISHTVWSGCLPFSDGQRKYDLEPGALDNRLKILVYIAPHISL